MVPEVDLKAFVAAHAQGALILDVREPFEYVSGHVPGALPLPLSAVHTNLSRLPTDQPVYVICASGNRSKTAASWLRSAGVDAISVAPGTGGWVVHGGPVVRGTQPHAAVA